MVSNSPPGGGLGPIAPAPGLGLQAPPPGEVLSGNPPGLWQPPGLGGIGGPPPAAVPPPAPNAATPADGSLTVAAAGDLGLGAVGEGRGHDLQKEISGTIEAQVSKLIEQARHDTESKVKMELKQIRDAMVVMDQQLDNLIAQLDGIEPQEPAETPLDADQVGQLLSKIEQQWGQEIRTLKQELHQTILAHNHNADLITRQKDMIDALRDKCDKLQGSNVKTTEIQALFFRLERYERLPKLEPLFERLSALEQRVTASAAMRYFSMPPVVPPGMPVPPGIPPAMMPGMSRRG